VTVYVPPTLETINGCKVVVRQSPTSGYSAEVWVPGQDPRTPGRAFYNGADYAEARALAVAFAEAWTGAVAS